MRDPFTTRVSVYGRALSHLGPYSLVRSHKTVWTGLDSQDDRAVRPQTQKIYKLIFSPIFATQAGSLFHSYLRCFLFVCRLIILLQVQDLPSSFIQKRLLRCL